MLSLLYTISSILSEHYKKKHTPKKALDKDSDSMLAALLQCPSHFLQCPSHIFTMLRPHIRHSKLTAMHNYFLPAVSDDFSVAFYLPECRDVSKGQPKEIYSDYSVGIV